MTQILYFDSLRSALRGGWPVAALLALPLVGLTPAAFGQSFAGKVDYATGVTGPRAVAVGDLNADGRPDLVVGGTGTIGVLLAQGAAGAFAAPAAYAAGGTENDVVTLADLNGDGRLDIVTTTYDGNRTVVFLNSATTPGTFAAGVSYLTGGTNPIPVGVADMNGDGRPDIVVANRNQATVGVLLNSATTPGTFGTATTYSYGSGFTYGLRLGDVNNDGRPDVVVTLQTANQVGVLLNSAITPGSLGTVALYATLGSASDEVRLGDLNSDGRLDIVTANVLSDNVSVLLAAGAAGTFTTAVTYPGGGQNVAVALGDVTGDGRLDIVTPVGNGNTVSVLPGLAGGTFSALVPFTIGAAGGSAHLGVEVADLNGDGRPDIVATNVVGNTVSVLLNSGTYAVLALTSVNPTGGPVGTVVTLTGTALTGATAVTFNGTAATSFTVNSATQITATVPVGTTTGNVTVTTPAGTSNGVTFTVLTNLVVSTGTQLSPTLIPAGSYNNITVTSTGNGVLAGNVSVASALVVQPGGGLSDGCAIISGAGSFTLGAGSILGICNAAGISSSGPTGSVQVTGTRSYSTAASYGYNTAATVTGNGLPATVLNLAINTATDVTLTAPVAVTQAVGVGGAGDLQLNGQALTLLSSAAGTALVVNTGTGTVVGNTTVQRYIDGSLNAGLGYRHLSAPVFPATVAGFGSGGTPLVVNSAYNSSATPGTVTPFPTVYSYDQARLATSPATSLTPFDKGWLSPVSLGDAAQLASQGFTVQLPGASTLSFTGQVGNGSGTIPMSRASGATAADAGWNFVGNPYPAPVDFSTVPVGNRVNLDGAMYVFESAAAYTGAYRTYINGVGGNPLIGTAQGFWMRVSSGQTSGSLALNNSNRVTSYAQQQPVRRGTATDPRPLVQLDLRGATGPTDALYAYAQVGATPAFDSQFDAEKIANSTGLNLSSSATSGQRLAIDGRPVFDAATVLPLNVGVPAAGTYTFAAIALNNLPAGLDAYLSDAQTGQTVNLRTQPSYGFTVSAAQATALLVGRFVLRFAAGPLAVAPSLTAAQVGLYPNPAHGRFAVLMPGVVGATGVEAELVNALGQVVRRQSAALPASGTTLTVETGELAVGVYTLRLRAGSTTLAKRVVLQ